MDIYGSIQMFLQADDPSAKIYKRIVMRTRVDRVKKLVLVLVLSVVNSNVIAEWTEIDTSNRVGLTAYADPATIIRSGDKAEMWVLYDYKTVQKNSRKSYISIRGQWRYDCKEKKEQPVYEILLSENMGKGKVVGKAIYDVSVEWMSVTPESVGMAFWKLACGK